MKNFLDKRLLFVSIALHIGMIFLLAVFYPDSRIRKTFLVYGAYSKHQTHAYFRPLKAPSYSLKRQFTKVTGARRKSARKSATKLAVKKDVKKIVKHVQKNVQSKKPVAKVRTEITKSKPIKKQVKAKKPEPKKLVRKKVEEKIKPTKQKVHAKKEVVKKEIEKKEAIKSKEVKKEIKQEEKSEEKLFAKNENEIEDTKQERDKANNQEQDLQKQDLLAEIEGDDEMAQEDEQLHFNLMGEFDPKVVMYQKCIQEEVERVWRPPLGVSRGTECEGAFIIDSNGYVKHFEIKKSSKMMIYDLSIVRVAKKFEFDRCLWGKAFTINFRQ